MKSNTGKSLKILTECAILIALSTVLSIFTPFEMPYGGSITLASVAPLVVLAYRHGVKYAAPAALTASLLQALLGLKHFSNFTTWESIVALLVFDYVIAFAIFGFSGMFRKLIRMQNLSMVSGALLASVIRYACHTISGATVWAGLSIPNEAALLYSMSYNATYMIPETIILLLTVAYLGSALDFRRDIPTRIKNEKLDTVSVYALLCAGFTLLATLITDTVLVFSNLQSETGEFAITGLASVNWIAVGIVSAVGLCITAIPVILAVKRSRRLH